MSDPDETAAESQEATGPDETPEPEWKRRRRLAAVFGDVLPEGTRDDTDDRGDGESGTSEEWLKRQVPPHHG